MLGFGLSFNIFQMEIHFTILNLFSSVTLFDRPILLNGIVYLLFLTKQTEVR